MAALRIVALSVLAAVLYGVVHDQVTARICVEYFTVAHPRILATESPTILGLAWGVLGTWWVGLVLGLLLAFACTLGSAPRRAGRSLVRPIAILLACMAGASAIAGLVGYALASRGIVVLVEPFSSRIPADRHVRFVAVGWSHAASYLVGFVGGIVLVTRTWMLRRRAAPDA